MNKRRFYLYLLIVPCLLVIGVSFAACQPGMPFALLDSTEYPLSTDTQTPTLTPTRFPSQTPSVTPSPTQTLTPTTTLFVQDGTPLPETLVKIDAGNAKNISALAVWKHQAVSDLEWTADGFVLAVSSDEGISFYDALSRSMLRALYPQQAGIVDIAFSPDGRWLVAGSRQQVGENDYISKLELWQGPDWKPRGVLYDVRRGVSRITFSPNGEVMAAAYPGNLPYGSTIDFWNTTRWQITETLRIEAAVQIDFSPEGNLFAASPDRYAVRVWDFVQGELLWKIHTSFTDAVNVMVFSPFGDLLATGHYDGSIRIWDMQTGDLLQTMHYEGAVEALAFNQDGSLLAAAGSFGSNEVGIWSVADGEMLNSLGGHNSGVIRVLFSPGGNYLVSASYEGTIRLWGVRP